MSERPIAASELRTEVWTEFGSDPARRAAWDEAVARLGGSVYMTFDWLRTWWEFYGAGRELRLFWFRSGERVVGCVPIYIDTPGVGFVKLRIARLVGANVPPKVFNPAVDEAAAAAILGAMVERLFGADGCDVTSLGPISGHQRTLDLWEAAAREDGGRVGRTERRSGVHSIFWLPANMEEYYESLSKNERKNRRKYELRMLGKECETKVELVSEPALVEEEFERFAVQHARQWQAEGKSGHFGAWPRALEFNRALVRAQARCGRVRFIRIVAGGKVVSNQYVFDFGDTYFWELPSREVGSEWDRFSLGPTGIVQMLEVGIREGKARVEGGLAHYDYKIRLGAKEYSADTLRLFARGSSGGGRMQVFGMFRRLMELAYHKGWYRRVMPHLPAALRRPQWMAWLRLDY